MWDAPRCLPGDISHFCVTARARPQASDGFCEISDFFENIEYASIEPNQRLREFEGNRDA